MEYINTIEKEKLYNCMDLWNNEVGFIFPIDEGTFNHNILSYDKKEAYLAYDEIKLVGFIIIKTFYNENILLNYNNKAFISLMYVSKKYRNKGIGTTLLKQAEEKLNGYEVNVGKDLRNFFPGVLNDFDNLGDKFFINRGYSLSYYTHDLICRDISKKEYFTLNNKEIKYEFIGKNEKDELLKFIKDNNWERWVYEAQDYLNNCTKNNIYLVGKDKNKIISFAVVNSLKDGKYNYNMIYKNRFDNLGGIGPLGVDKDYRKKGLGYDIVAKAFNILKDNNVSDIMIDWTGLMEFYRQFGFEVFKTYRCGSKNI